MTQNLFDLADLAAECRAPAPVPASLDLDRGPCLVLAPGTLDRCTGRMVASYAEPVGGFVPWPVWTCTVCSKVRVP